MLADVNTTLLLVVCLSILAIGLITGIVILVKSIISSKKDGSYLKLKYNLVAILLVIIATASWVLNMGWLRFIMTFLAVPVIHTIAFMIINNFSLSYIDESVKLKRFVVLSYVTYITGYLLLPDSADIGPMYVFFGLIHNDIFANIAYNISSTAFAANIVFLILQLAERKKAKKEN